MPRGSRPGERRGGRQPGTPNKRTVEREKAMREAALKAEEAIGEGAFSGDAHALLMMTYKDTALPLDTRLEAAKAAIAYEKPKLANIDQTLSGNVGYTAI